LLKLIKIFIPIIFIFLLNTNAYSEEYISKNNVNIQYEKKNEKLAKYILDISKNVMQSVTKKTGINYNKQLNIKISPK
jgi:hypothetical protein